MRQLYVVILFFMMIKLNAQSIRKDYQEMTSSEKVNLVNAFYELRTGADLISDLANFHANYFGFENSDDPNGLSIHLNLPDRPENDIFFAWHRRQMFEIEQAMQDINPSISMPFWDSSIDQSVNSSLWDQNFLGQFDGDWNLNRNLGGSGPLPTPQDVINVNANTDFLLFSNDTERGSTHTGAHRWVGGDMRTGRSPRDPAFYLHHTNVDRLWNEWHKLNQSSTFQQTSMIRYNGSYVFDGITLASVNPNDIVDTRFFGTFYALNGLVVLDNYSVSNTYNAQEYFYYQFTIQVGNNFVVPAGTDCKIESVSEIIFQPGFEAISGSTFIASIDVESFDKAPLSKRGNEIVRNQIPFENFVESKNVYDNFELVEINSQLYPNPFSNQLTIQLNKKIENGKVLIYDIMGRIVRHESTNNLSLITISNLFNLSSGVYLLHVVDETGNILINEKAIKIE